jgi:hypothetical protein
MQVCRARWPATRTSVRPFGTVGRPCRTPVRRSLVGPPRERWRAAFTLVRHPHGGLPRAWRARHPHFRVRARIEMRTGMHAAGRGPRARGSAARARVRAHRVLVGLFAGAAAAALAGRWVIGQW